VNRRTARGPRRVPTQDRSKRRFEQILDAAAEAFAESSYDAVTMEAVAARAETSIGSLYQFFTNKRALFNAVAARCLSRSQAAFELVSAPSNHDLPLGTALDGVIDAFAGFLTDPGFRAVWQNLQLYGDYADADAALIRGFVESTERALVRRGLREAPARRHLIATMTVQTIAALLFLAARESPAFGAKMLAETKVLLRRYLEPYLP
jgi:AcrR family transcriptional regulator